MTDSIPTDRVTDEQIHGLIRHFDKMAAMHGSVNYDVTAAALRELQRLRSPGGASDELAAELLADDALLQKAIALYATENRDGGPWIEQGRRTRIAYLRRARASFPEPGAGPVAWLDENGWLVRLETTRNGGTVSAGRAIPDSWTPLYARRAPEPRGECEWKEDSNTEMCLWESACGKSWCFEDAGTPSEHGCKFCHGCGKPLKEVRWTWPADNKDTPPETKDGKL